jgi:hypothetical protein
LNVEIEDMEPNELPDYLASIRHINTYKAPPQYFDTLAEDILDKVHVPMAAEIPFSAPPAGYFDGLVDNILQKIKSAPKSDVQQELEEVDSFLASVSKTNPYTVPQGYFETFSLPLETKEEKAPLIKMSRRPARWITYAAAAVVTGIVATGVIMFTGKDDSVPPQNVTAALAKVSDNDLADYLDNASADIDVTPVSNTNLGSDGLYKQLLNNVSDNDIQQYLNQNEDGNETNNTGI